MKDRKVVAEDVWNGQTEDCLSNQEENKPTTSMQKWHCLRQMRNDNMKVHEISVVQHVRSFRCVWF